MRALERAAVAAAGCLFALVGVASPVPASGVDCPPGHEWDPIWATCVIKIEIPPGGGTPIVPGPPGSDPVPIDPKCIEPISGDEVPCQIGDWHWVQGWLAYAKLTDPQPPKSDPVWGGNDDGAIYTTGRWLGDPRINPGEIGERWAPEPPWDAIPNPIEIALEAVAAMQLRAVNIGIVPDDADGSVGLIGLPTWMWAENPTENTVGPITRSASAGGYTVTATGELTQVVWDMGDGTTVTCDGRGTPYEDSYLDSDSPDCGHRYQSPGEYTVTPTSYWTINWSGMGQSGVFHLEVSDSTTITIGEAQVIVQ